MEFKMEKRTIGRQKEEVRQEDFELAYKFSKILFREMGDMLKALVLFGSTARTGRKEKDIDLLVIVDDVTVRISPELVETYRIITEKAVVEVSERLHITSMKFSSFWEYARAGDPVAVNILREGIPLIDAGFFRPLQALLFDGRIRPSPESVWTYFARSPRALFSARRHVLGAVLDLYWAVVDSAHASLMMLNVTPPSPDHVAELLDKMLVARGLLKPHHVETMKKFYDLQKRVVHRELKELKGAEYDELYKEAAAFVDDMKRFVESREFASDGKKHPSARKAP